MKIAISIVTVLALTVLAGCQSDSARGGGLSRDEGFQIVVPRFATDLKQGESQSVAISLHRGDDFKRDVTLEVRASQGISVEPSTIVIKAGDKPATQVRVSAAKDAAIGGFQVYVKGTPESGEPTSTEFNVKVVAP